MADVYRYAAFISYSSKDAAFARRLHRALESYGIPSSLGKFDLIGGGKANRVYPVFRDREELSAGHLGDQIEANLRASASLVVVCSPDGAASPWVQKEIEYFAAQGRHAKIFAIIPDTAPLVDEHGADATQKCFPPAFRGDALTGDKLEPLAADARKGKDGFRNAWLKIVAGMVGVTPGQIIDRDKKRRAQQRTAAIAASAAAILISGYVAAGVDAQRWRGSLSAYAEDTLSRGRSLDALPFALASAAPQGSLLISASRSDALAKLGALPVRQQLGTALFYGFSHDGRYLVTIGAGWEGTLRDLRNGGAPIPLGKIRQGEPHNFAFSPDNTLLVTQSPEGAGTMFYLDQSRESRSLGYFEEFAFAPDGATLLTRDAAGVESLWPLRPEGAPRVLGRLESQFSSDSQWLYSVDPNSRASLRSLVAGGAPIDLGPVYRYVDGPIFSPDGAFVVTRDETRSATLRAERENWRARPLGVISNHSFSSDSNYLFVDGAAGGALLYDLRTMSPVRNVGDTRGFYQLSNDASFLLTQQADGTGMLWPVRTNGAAIALGPLLYDSPGFGFTPDGRYVLTQDPRRQGVLRDLRRDGAQTNLGLLWQVGYYNFAFSNDSKFLITRSLTDSGTLWDLRADTPQPLTIGDLGGFDFSPSGEYLITADQQYRWTLRALGRDAPPVALGAEMEHWVFSPDGASLFTLDTRYRAVLYDLASWIPPDRVGRVSTVCAASGDAMPPLPLDVRRPRAQTTQAADVETDDAQRASAEAIFTTLEGRPWNPCDWRGLLAVLPDDRGAGWFEGVRQWARLVSVRHFGGHDYVCGEVNAAGDMAPQRVAACRTAESEDADHRRAQGRGD